MKTNGKGTAHMFEEPLSGPEVVARVDAAILKVGEVLNELKSIRAGIHDLEGLDAKPVKMEPVKGLILTFDSRHRQTFKDPTTGEPIGAVIAWGKDNAIMKRIREAHGDERTEQLIDAFFADRNEYCERMGYTIQTFSARVSALVARTARPARLMGVTQNTDDNQRNAGVAASMIREQYGAHR